MSTLPDKLEEALKNAETYKGFVDRAAEQASKFSADVIARVVSGHRQKLSDALEGLRPLVAEVQGVIAAHSEEIAKVQGGAGSSSSALEELNLRLLIGELSQEDFDAAAATLKEDVSDAADKVTSMENELEVLRDLFARCSAVFEEDITPLAPAPTSETGEEKDVVVELSADDAEIVEDPIESGNADGLFADDASEEVAMDDADDLDLGSSEEEGDDLDLDELALDDDDIELEAPVTTIEKSEEQDDLDLSDALSEPAVSEKKGNAALIYREGTEDEEAFRIDKDEVWLGRRRDVNDIMVKNDAKVSRFHHCRIFKREGNFFIEDPKSSNGTLVNGDRLPNGEERRLYGDEEVTIGETYYRFRLVD